MRKYFVFFFLFFAISAWSSAFAATKTVTINWNTSGSTQDIQSYKMIYSYSSNMANPIDACTTNDNTVTSLTCQDIQITSEDVYFRIVATTNQQTTTESNIQHIIIPITTISTVQGFQMGIPNNTPPPGTGSILDDFSTDTSSNYSFISGSISVQNGAAHGQEWRKNLVYHTTSLESPNQIISAQCSFTENDPVGIVARFNPTTQSGYYILIRTSEITLWKFTGTSSTWVASSTGTYSSPTQLEIIATDNNIVAKVNNIVQIDVTDSTFSSGNFCGLVIDRGRANTDITVDYLKGISQ